MAAGETVGERDRAGRGAGGEISPWRVLRSMGRNSTLKIFNNYNN